MTDKTKQKIINAALKIFAREGYKSATTKSIADESGFTETTLFRKFDNKGNLFDIAMIHNYEMFMKDYISFVNNLEPKNESTNEFLFSYVKKLEKYFSENIEFLSLMVNEEQYKKIEFDMEELNTLIGKYLEKNIKNDKIDYTALGVYINSFLYMVVHEKYLGRKTFSNEDPVNKFIENLCLCF